nr:hypothetical protein [Tanacetum cinerariifolium]
MNRLKIDNLTQEILVGPASNLLKGTCKSFAKLEFHFKECYKAVTDRLDWHNLKGREYPFDLSKPLPLIEDQGCHVVPTNYFINNDLEYWKGRSSSSKYVTSTTRTKAANVKVMRWYDYRYLEEIIVQRDDNVLYKFKKGDLLRLKLHDIEDMLLLLVQKKLSNLDVDDRYDLGVALRMFTRRIVILHRVKDLQLGVESHQKNLNITRTETTRSNISKLTPYTAYKNPQGIIYQDTYKRNKLSAQMNFTNSVTGCSHLQIQRDLNKDIPLDSVVVLMYEKKSKSENKGKVPTKMELELEQTQQGSSYEVSVSVEWVKDLKRQVKIKGEKKEALLTLRQKSGQYICCQESQR